MPRSRSILAGGGHARRRLSAEFATLEEFQRAYRRSIANGGLFVPTEEHFSVMEALEVELLLRFRNETVLVPAEVVSFVPLRFVPPGGTPGVSVQFKVPLTLLRQRLGRLVEVQVPAPPPAREQRSAPRQETRVAGRVEAAGSARAAQARELSLSGALVAVEGPPVPVGQRVDLVLVHPTSGEQRRIRGEVVRHAQDRSGGLALAIRFDVEGSDSSSVLGFVEDAQRAEAARGLGRIAGPLELLGLPALLQMLASGVERGTLRIEHRGHTGVALFESGALLHASFGPVSGAKALARMLALPDGVFEFEADVDRSLPLGPPVPVYVALLEATRQLDERRRFESTALGGADARLRLAEESPLVAGDLSKLESALLELARRGAPVRSGLDELPDSDAEILKSIQALLERGLLTLD